jgi:protein-S-isoprenylcysteine O-methyltransferase Ste14
MLAELLTGAFFILIIIVGLLLYIIKIIEKHDERKLSERLSRSFKPGDSFDDVRFKDYEK